VRRDRLGETERHILPLRRVRIQRVLDRGAVGAHERQVAAFLGELEIGVELCARLGAVLSRGEDEKLSARLEEGCGETPLRQLVGVVGEVPTAELDGGRRAALNLDPVGVAAVLVRNPRPILGKDLRNDDVLRSRHRLHGGELQEQREREPPRASGPRRLAVADGCAMPLR
jgi:hypothetical protein